jgi:hypothetical protein
LKQWGIETVQSAQFFWVSSTLSSFYFQHPVFDHFWSTSHVEGEDSDNHHPLVPIFRISDGEKT